MHRYVMGPSRMTVQHKKKLVELAHAGMLEHELQVAIEYSASLVTHRDWMLALGTQAALTTPKDVLKQMGADGTSVCLPDEVKFGGAFGWLDLKDRCKPMSEMDVGRMRWACETLDETHKFSKVLGDIAVRGGFASTDTWEAAMLRRVDIDASIDVVCLSHRSTS